MLNLMDSKFIFAIALVIILTFISFPNKNANHFHNSKYYFFTHAAPGIVVMPLVTYWLFGGFRTLNYLGLIFAVITGGLFLALAYSLLTYHFKNRDKR